MKYLAALVIAAFSTGALAQVASDSTKRDIQQFFAHPLFATGYTCSEHAAGELPYLGDDLGQDCIAEEFVNKGGAAFMGMYATDGLKNEDWYGWNKPVLAPCECTVASVYINSVINLLGHPGKPPASSIELLAADGIHVVLAHVKDVKVKAGDKVKAGQPIAHVGNNGFARNPHIHIGTWRGLDALQIRWNQKNIPIL